MSTWLVPRQDLTEDQLKAVVMGTNRHHVLVGPPGSGKTQILLHRTRHLLDAHGEGQEYRIFVFTKVLKSYIASAMEVLRLPADRAINYDRWLYDLYGEHVGAKRPWTKNAWGKAEPDYTAIRQAVLEGLRDGTIRLPLFDFVLVDEAQDMDRTVLEILSLVSRHVTVCMDDAQQLYEGGIDEATAREILGRGRSNTHLLGAYRCSPYIAAMAAAFLSDDGARKRYERQVKTYAPIKQTPVVHVAKTFVQERDRLVEAVKSRLKQGERVAVLFPQKKQVHGFAKAFAEAGVEVEVRQDTFADPDAPAMDFASDVPKLMTYQSAKGLTFDSVFLPRLQERSFWMHGEEQVERTLFVGITRATTWCFLSGVEKGLLSAISTRLDALEEAGRIVVQRPSPAVKQVARTDPTSTGTSAEESSPGDGRVPAKVAPDEERADAAPAAAVAAGVLDDLL